MKKTVLAVILLLFLPSIAFAQSVETVMNGLDFADFEGVLNELGNAISIQETVLSLAKGETVLSLQALMHGLFERVMAGLYGSVLRITRLVLPAVLCSLVNTFMQAEKQALAKDITGYACFLMVAAVMVQDLSSHLTLSSDTVANMTRAMQSLFPLLLGLLAAIGGTASAAFFQPAVVAASGFMTSLIANVTLPCAVFQAVLVMLDHVADTIKVSRLSALFRQIGIWTLGVSFTVFIGVTLIQGLGTAAVDGISIRTAKYTIDNFVPIVGGMFADTVDTLVGCSLVIKNALGLTGLVVLIGICVGPMLQTLLSAFVYRLSAALLQPAAESRMVHCIQDFSDVLMMLFIIQLSVAAMFVLLIAQMLIVGNMTVMLR